MEQKESKKANIITNIFLCIIVMAFLIGTTYMVINNNKKYDTLEGRGYSENIINLINNET